MTTQVLTRPKGHVRPSPETAIRVREFVQRWTEPVASECFGVNVATIARVAAGFTVQGANLRVIEQGLSTPAAEVESISNALRTRKSP